MLVSRIRGSIYPYLLDQLLLHLKQPLKTPIMTLRPYLPVVSCSCLLILFTLAGPFSAGAQPDQEPAVFVAKSIAGFNCYNQKLAVDMDGDGDLDVLVTPYSAESAIAGISWYEQDGAGQFSERPVFTTAGIVAGAYPLDVDADGDMDLITARQEVTNDGDVERRTVWWENQGKASWTPHEMSADFWYLKQVTRVDFDRDGDDDILFVHRKGNRYGWYENQGKARFTEHTLPLPPMPGEFSARDIDGDQDIDLLFSTESTLGWYERGSDQDFTWHLVDSTATASGASHISPEDMDADGDLDILFVAAGQYHWYEQGANRQFNKLAPSRLGTNDRSGYLSFAAGDVDGDGLTDLIGQKPYGNSKYTSSISWYRNQGTGQFGENQVIYDQHNGEYWDLLPQDLNADGRLDILSGCSWYMRTADAGAVKHPIADAGGTAIQATDLDGDGDMDVVSSQIRRPGITWHEQGQNGEFTPRTLSESLEITTPLQIIDLDRDGDPDLLCKSKDKISWLENNGRAKFTERLIVSLDRMEGLAPPADLNGDGYPDLLIVGVEKNRLLVNDGGRQFAEKPIDIQFDRGRKLAADLDGDGDQDLCSVGRNGPASWHENTGDFQFVKHPLYQPGAMSPTAQLTHAADLDGDGTTDVLFSLRGDPEYNASGYLALSKNQGGEFTTQVVYPQNTRSIATADVDGDGDLDIVAPFGPLILWLENDGQGQFSEHTIATDRAYAICLADMDGDGDLDVVAIGDTISWYEMDIR